MIEYRITVDPSKDGWTDEEDRLIRAAHADALCDAVWKMREELREAFSHPAEDCQITQAERWFQRLNAILYETGAAAAMERYT
jgi:hypothetical protein